MEQAARQRSKRRLCGGTPTCRALTVPAGRRGAWPQVDAREKMLRDELLGGQELPSISEAIKDAAALVALLGAHAPQWVRALEGGGAPRVASAVG